MKQKFTGTKRRNMTGWAFLLPATILIFAMSFYPMIQAFILSFKSGIGNNLVWSGLSNYKRLLGDGVFKTAMVNNFVYLIIQVPVMLILAILLAVLLNKPHLKCKGLFRTAIFLPCCQHGTVTSGPDSFPYQLAGTDRYSKSYFDYCADLEMDRV